MWHTDIWAPHVISSSSSILTWLWCLCAGPFADVDMLLSAASWHHLPPTREAGGNSAGPAQQPPRTPSPAVAWHCGTSRAHSPGLARQPAHGAARLARRDRPLAHLLAPKNDVYELGPPPPSTGSTISSSSRPRRRPSSDIGRPQPGAIHWCTGSRHQSRGRRGAGLSLYNGPFRRFRASISGAHPGVGAAGSMAGHEGGQG